jgi:hypothetical protein
VKKLSKSFVIEAAVSAFFLPDATDQATFARRLDRLTRQYERLEHSLTILAEAFAQFVRFWIIATPPPPSAMMKQCKPRRAIDMPYSSRRSLGGW